MRVCVCVTVAENRQEAGSAFGSDASAGGRCPDLCGIARHVHGPQQQSGQRLPMVSGIAFLHRFQRRDNNSSSSSIQIVVIVIVIVVVVLDLLATTDTTTSHALLLCRL